MIVTSKESPGATVWVTGETLIVVPGDAIAGTIGTTKHPSNRAATTMPKIPLPLIAFLMLFLLS
jgi:hypothetical protein